MGWVRLGTSVTGNLKKRDYASAVTRSAGDCHLYPAYKDRHVGNSSRGLRTVGPGQGPAESLYSVSARFAAKFTQPHYRARPESRCATGRHRVIEFIFGLPGIGGKLLQSVFSRDVVMVQGLAVFMSMSYVVINTLIDLAYLAVDPPNKEPRSMTVADVVAATGVPPADSSHHIEISPAAKDKGRIRTYWSAMGWGTRLAAIWFGFYCLRSDLHDALSDLWI